MRKVWVILFCIASVGGLRAQTFSELFRQKKTEEKYLLKQIAELQGYIALARKGYGIVTDGLGFIGDLKDGTFRLDKDYFSSLELISPTISNDEGINNTLLRYNDIRLLRGQSKKLENNVFLQASEKKYIDKVWENLLSRCADDMNQLDGLTTPGKYRMKESERMAAIQTIYQAMQDKYDFASSFHNEVRVLILQRTQEKAAAMRLQNLYKKKGALGSYHVKVAL